MAVKLQQIVKNSLDGLRLIFGRPYLTGTFSLSTTTNRAESETSSNPEGIRGIVDARCYLLCIQGGRYGGPTHLGYDETQLC
jgi:hypothetical protein